MELNELLDEIKRIKLNHCPVSTFIKATERKPGYYECLVGPGARQITWQETKDIAKFFLENIDIFKFALEKNNGI